MAKNKTLTEYEAAVATGMSPELLRWLTKNPPKMDDKRVLPVAPVKNDIYEYDEAELQSFNAWLKKPWPHKDGKRPNLPAGIKREIKIEANGECAMCHKHGDTCEIAHLDPVATTYNNHPENLLLLCSNHHTAYDKNLYGPKAGEADFVRHFKQTLFYFRRAQWMMQQELSHKMFAMLQTCSVLANQLNTAKTSDQAEAIKDLAERAIAVMPTIAPLSKTDPNYQAYQAISVEALSLSVRDTPVDARLRKAKKIRSDYVAAFGFVPCPLCHGSGEHDGTDCPVCNGDREIDKNIAERVDLQDFAIVECPVCHGAGTLRGEPCPVCGGYARMERRYAERVDAREYDLVDCPLCKGSGRFQSDRCPACDGDCRKDRRYADRIDPAEYDEVDCPVCEGTGSHDGDTCRVCHGDRQMPRHIANQIDTREYTKVDCPLCAGTGRFKGDDCPVCGGERQIDRVDLDRVDVREFEDVDCPVCDGDGRYNGSDCRACDASGKVERRHLSQIDPDDFA